MSASKSQGTGGWLSRWGGVCDDGEIGTMFYR